MAKVIRDGMVAVLVSPGYGAGLSTWSYSDKTKELLTFGDENLVRLIEEKDYAQAEEYITVTAKMLKEEETPYLGGLSDTVVRWVPVGTKFVIEEYDGAESLMTEDDFDWSVA